MSFKTSKPIQAAMFVFGDLVSIMSGGLSVLLQISAVIVERGGDTHKHLPSYWLYWGAFLAAWVFAIRIAYRFADLTSVHLHIKPTRKEFIHVKTLSSLVRVSVTNSHPSKTAKNVRLALVALESISKPEKSSFVLGQMNFPVFLPENGNQNAVRCEIPPKPSEQIFDLAFVSGEFPSPRWLGVGAPSPIETAFNVDTRSFKITEPNGPPSIFKIKLQVTADDMPTAEISFLLTIPTKLNSKSKYEPPVLVEEIPKKI